MDRIAVEVRIKIFITKQPVTLVAKGDKSVIECNAGRYIVCMLDDDEVYVEDSDKTDNIHYLTTCDCKFIEENSSLFGRI